jgi:hypothetical protein
MSKHTDANYLKGLKQDENHKKQCERRNKKADETAERHAKIMEIRKERGLLNSFEKLDLTATCICGQSYDTLGNHLKTCKIANTIVCELCNKSYIGYHNCKKNTCVCGKICNDKHLLVCRVAKKIDGNTPILCECGETYLKKNENRHRESKSCEEKRKPKTPKTDDIIACDCGKSYLYRNRVQHLSTKYHLRRVRSV